MYDTPSMGGAKMMCSNEKELLKELINNNIDAYAVHGLEVGKEYTEGRISAYKHVLSMLKLIEEGMYDSRMGR